MLKEIAAKEALKILGLAIAGYFIFVYDIPEAFKPPRVTFQTLVHPPNRRYRITIVNRLEKIEDVSVIATFFTKVVMPKTVVYSGGRLYRLEGECVSYSPLTYVFDRVDSSSICLKPSDTISIETLVPDTLIDISRVREPEVCLSCSDFPSCCTSTAEKLGKWRVAAVALFVALAVVFHYKSLSFCLNKTVRAGIYYMKYRKRRKRDPREAEDLFAGELSRNLNARCFFYWCCEKTIRRHVKILSPYLDKKH